ncbi:helix-turn-helix domain-containing protein [Faecalimonas sp.]
MYLKRLKDLRTDHDLTQENMADILKCHREVYRRYESGIRTLPIDYLVTIAKYYNTSTDYLLELTDVKTPYPQTQSHKKGITK